MFLSRISFGSLKTELTMPASNCFFFGPRGFIIMSLRCKKVKDLFFFRIENCFHGMG